MKEIISKELLSEVLGENVMEFYPHVSAQHLGYYYKAEDYDDFLSESEINIHELAHRVKEWAWRNHRLMIFQSAYFPEYRFLVKDLNVGLSEAFNTTCIADMFSAPTEPEAIFKAGQWILENRR